MPRTSSSSAPGRTGASITASTASAPRGATSSGHGEDFRIHAERVVPGRDGMYVLLLRLQARGKGSGVTIDAEVANVATMRDGRITRLEMHWDRDAAISAAGAREDGG